MAVDSVTGALVDPKVLIFPSGQTFNGALTLNGGWTVGASGSYLSSSGNLYVGSGIELVNGTGNIAGTYFNGITITSSSGTLNLGSGSITLNNGSIAGTTGKTLTYSDTLTLAGTDGSTLNIGSGGTLGSMAYQAASSVAITGGAVNGTTIGATTAGAGSFTTLNTSGTSALSDITATSALGKEFAFVTNSANSAGFDYANCMSVQQLNTAAFAAYRVKDATGAERGALTFGNSTSTAPFTGAVSIESSYGIPYNAGPPYNYGNFDNQAGGINLIQTSNFGKTVTSGNIVAGTRYSVHGVNGTDSVTYNGTTYQAGNGTIPPGGFTGAAGHTTFTTSGSPTVQPSATSQIMLGFSPTGQFNVNTTTGVSAIQSTDSAITLGLPVTSSGTINGITITSSSGTLNLGSGSITLNNGSIAGTTGKTLTYSDTLTLAGTDGSTLNIGSGGTLGTGAYATIANYAPLASPTFTGTPAAPTAAAGTSTTQLATTAFVQTSYAAPPAIGNTTPGNGTFSNLTCNNGGTLTCGGNFALNNTALITTNANTDPFVINNTSANGYATVAFQYSGAYKGGFGYDVSVAELVANANGSFYILTNNGTQAAQFDTSQNAIFTALVTAKHFGGNGTAPTIAAGAGAGPGNTTTITGHDSAGVISVLTAGTPTASAVIATITFNTAYANAPYVTLTPASATTGVLTTAKPYVTATTTTFVINSEATALTTVTTYLWNYHVEQ